MYNLAESISNLPLFEYGVAGAIIVVGFVVGLIRRYENKKLKTIPYNEYPHINWNVHSQIHELLTELRIESVADRVKIVQFHNGGTFVDGVSMMKMSLTHESVSKGVSAESGRLQSILISLFSPIIVKIIEDLPTFYVTKNEKDTFSKNYLLGESVYSFMALPLKHNSNITGYLMMQWCSPSKSNVAHRHIENITTGFLTTRNLIQVHLEEQLRNKIIK